VTGVPIVIGIASHGISDHGGDARLRTLLTEELSAQRTRYPHSPVVLLTAVAEPLRPLAQAVAAPLGIAIVGGAQAAIADHCHVLIRIGPQAAAGARDAGIHLESRFQVEFVDVLPADAPGGSWSVARRWSMGTDFDLPVSTKVGARALRRTDDFNRDVALLREHSASAPPLFRPGHPLSDERCARLHELFMAADTLSSTYQRKVERTFQLIFLLAGAAVVIYGLFSAIASVAHRRFEEWLLLPYLLLLLAAYAIYYGARRSRIHQRFVEYRALAEGVRVQFYWCALRLERAVADRYLVRHPLQVYWIRLAMRSAVSAAARDAAPPTAAANEDLLRYWIARECSYYTRTVARAHQAQLRSRRVVGALFLLGIIATLLVLLQSQLTVVVPYLKHLGLVSFVCPSIAAALVALTTRLGVPYRAQHHARMLELYSQAQRYWNERGAVDVAELAGALGEATLHESGEWTLFRRERGIDEPLSPFRRPQ
jgi:hypothetical protein